MSLTPEQKDAYKDSFVSLDAFYNWLVAAQEEYNNQPSDVILIGPGDVIDLS